MDTRPVREGKSAGVIHLVSGVLVTLWGLRALLTPQEIPTWREVQNAVIYQYGGAMVALFLGGVILAIGLLSFRHQAKPRSPATLVYVYEPHVFLAWVFGIPCILFGAMCMVAIAPYTAERGVVVGQIAA